MADRPDPANPEHGWGQLLPKFFDKGVAVHNHAVNGRSTKSFIDEGKWSAVLGELKAGDYVFIEFGHNDEKSEDSTRYAAATTDYRRNLERFVVETRSKGATPILLTPIVRRKFNATGELENTHGEYPRVVRELASTLHVPLIDLEASTRRLITAAGPEGSKRLYVWLQAGVSSFFPEGRQDDTHLSAQGATEVARLVAGALTTTEPVLGKHVRTASAKERSHDRFAPSG
jgi:DNA sulfur modification protein DndE